MRLACKLPFSDWAAVAYLSEASRPSDGCRSVEAERDGSRAAAAAHQDGSRAAAEVWAVTHAPVEARGDSHVAEAAVLGALPEADCYAAGFQAAAQPLAGSVAAEVAAGSLADALAAAVSFAEFPADAQAAAASFAELPEDDYSRAGLGVVLADDCSRDACPDTAGVAARGPNQTDCPTADAEPADPDDRCPPEHCVFPEEPDDYQERLSEEHYRSDDQG